MEANYALSASLDELGEVAGMSPQHFSHSFKRAFGISPKQFIIERRMTQANLLLSAGMLVKDVAPLVGYEDSFYFSRLFKRHCGCPPDVARQRG
jgi:AraC-like DNA-binding protein